MLMTPDGWYGLEVISAEDAVHRRGCAEIAALVRVGALRPKAPVFVAYHRSDAPYPDVCMALPVEEEEARAIMAGDPETLAGVLEQIVEAHAKWLTQVKRGKVN